MNEVIFIIEEAAEGGYNAKALGVDIFTDAETIDELRANIKDAVICHFEENQAPGVIRLHFVKEEFITV
ncbi:MAG: 2-oxoisovalerate dehydrogenase [Saprospiraceae bacterium]|nr:2-oxoisovalerate dehydrogenase [Saprospiraceae bacterium]